LWLWIFFTAFVVLWNEYKRQRKDLLKAITRLCRREERSLKLLSCSQSRKGKGHWWVQETQTADKGIKRVTLIPWALKRRWARDIVGFRSPMGQGDKSLWHSRSPGSLVCKSSYSRTTAAEEKSENLWPHCPAKKCANYSITFDLKKKTAIFTTGWFLHLLIIYCSYTILCHLTIGISYCVIRWFYPCKNIKGYIFRSLDGRGKSPDGLTQAQRHGKHKMHETAAGIIWYVIFSKLFFSK
jgi:hypothetical protein